MNFLKNLFTKKEQPIKSNADFWAWFAKNEKKFFDVVKSHKDIEKGFFDPLSEKLEELKDGYLYLAGMFDENTAELVLTPDGDVNNIVFVEELIADAPSIVGWKFTALKSATGDINIKMGDYEFNTENLFFYSNDHAAYPDEIDITVVHNDLNETNKQQVANGTYIFLDNYLGELDFVTTIDSSNVIGKGEAQKELVPISKLKDFLKWRQKEFIEKYEDTTYNTDDDEYSLLKAEYENGNMLIATINTNLLNWEGKSSHPWLAVMTIKYDGEDNNGMPHSKDYEMMNVIEDELLSELKNTADCLLVGRQTAQNEREIYFVCKDFREISKNLYQTQTKYVQKYEMEYEIYKDKYWQSFERFKNLHV